MKLSPWRPSLWSDCLTRPVGTFLLANTRAARRPGYVSRLSGLQVPGQLKYCLRFYYALVGFRRTDGTLAVYIHHEDSRAQEKVWTVGRSSKDIWTEVEITLQRPQATKVTPSTRYTRIQITPCAPCTTHVHTHACTQPHAIKGLH